MNFILESRAKLYTIHSKAQIGDSQESHEIETNRSKVSNSQQLQCLALLCMGASKAAALIVDEEIFHPLAWLWPAKGGWTDKQMN